MALVMAGLRNAEEDMLALKANRPCFPMDHDVLRSNDQAL